MERVMLWPNTLNYLQSKPTLTAIQCLQKETKIQTVYLSTLTQVIHHFTTPKMELSNVNQRASHGHKETQTMQSQTLEGEWRNRVSLWAYKLTNAWWKLIHVPIKIFNQQWVDLHSSPALSGEHYYCQ